MFVKFREEGERSFAGVDCADNALSDSGIQSWSGCGSIRVLTGRSQVPSAPLSS